MKEKVDDLVRLHKAMQEKLNKKSYLQQVQILVLVPDKWSRKYFSDFNLLSECNFNVFEYLVRTSHEIKE